ncbi:MAG: preprotein translocase subunit SecY, partial [Patescibacteria group bacterium]
YIPGIRPGVQTADDLRLPSGILTFFGATFLGLIAVLPILIQYLFKSTGIGTVSLLISGAGIIIIVGVVLDLIRQTNAQLQMHDYGKFY